MATPQKDAATLLQEQLMQQPAEDRLRTIQRQTAAALELSVEAKQRLEASRLEHMLASRRLQELHEEEFAILRSLCRRRDGNNNP